MKTPQVVEAIPVPAILIGPEDNVLGANELAIQLFPGLQIERNFLTGLRQPGLQALIASARAGVTTSCHLHHAMNGSDHRLLARCGPAGQGNVLLCIVDESDDEISVQMRQDFVANVSHELRSPLTAISSLLETLQGPAKDDPDAIDRFMPMLTGEVMRMQNLVSDLLALSKVESNERRLPRDLVMLQDCMHAAVETLAPLAASSTVELRTDLTKAPLQVRGDFDELRRVLVNLGENAIRYGGSPVTISVKGPVSGVLPGEPAALLEVSDNGAGIPAHHIPRLTERFYRVDGHRSRNAGGTGLGLAIVKHIANRHRGRLSISSTPEQGTTVTLALAALGRED